MGKLRQGLAWIVTALLRLLAAAVIVILTSVLLFVAGLVLTAFPCLAVFCVVQMCGPVLTGIGWVWLAAGAAAWVVLEVIVLKGTARSKRKAREEAEKTKEAGDGAEGNKPV